jgi:hypothetical protein
LGLLTPHPQYQGDGVSIDPSFQKSQKVVFPTPTRPPPSTPPADTPLELQDKESSLIFEMYTVHTVHSIHKMSEHVTCNNRGSLVKNKPDHIVAKLFCSLIKWIGFTQPHICHGV